MISGEPTKRAFVGSDCECATIAPTYPVYRDTLHVPGCRHYAAEVATHAATHPERLALRRAHEELDAIFRTRADDPDLFTALRRVEKVITDALAAPDSLAAERARAACYNQASGRAHRLLFHIRDAVDVYVREGRVPEGGEGEGALYR